MSSLLGNVAVLMGGTNSESEVSLWSGNAVLDSLTEQKIKCTGIDVAGNYVEELINGDFTCAFIALHGGFGEDGTVQGLLECLNIPYTGSGVLASALAMDKQRAKQQWKTLGLPIVPSYTYDEVVSDPSLDIYPLVVKPSSAGSSVGVSKVEKYSQFAQAYELASKHGAVVIEKWIDGDDIAVTILGGNAMPTVRIVPENKFYDFEAKYLAESTNYTCPGIKDASKEAKAQDIALNAYNALGCCGWGRVDLIEDTNGKIWILEVNTIPGLTQTSLVPKSAKVAGIEFNDLILNIVNSAKKRDAEVTKLAE